MSSLEVTVWSPCLFPNTITVSRNAHVGVPRLAAHLPEVEIACCERHKTPERDVSVNDVFLGFSTSDSELRQVAPARSDRIS